MATFEETEKTIKDHLMKLPKEVQDMIANSSWDQKIQEIGKKHNLRIDQIGILGNETMFVLLGMTHPDQYTHEIQTRLNVIASKAAEISNDATELIFKNIREKLMGIYSRASEETEIAPEEEKTLERTGIIVENDPTSAFTTSGRQYPISKDTGNRIPINTMGTGQSGRDMLLEEVEHPEMIAAANVPKPPYLKISNEEKMGQMPDTPKKDIISSKLDGAFSIPKKETDHTLDPLTPPKAPPPSGDPYREAI